MAAPANILIVDDESSVRFVLEEALARVGHQVTAVASGEAALERIASTEFDVALVDLHLGGVSGMVVLSALRQQSPNTAVIVMTGYASLETALEALRQGAHDYLFKPCQVVQVRESVRTALLKRQQRLREHELLDQLKQHLAELEHFGIALPAHADQPSELPPAIAESPETTARFLQRDGLIVDLMRHVVTVDGHILELSPTEFALLAYLVSESPRVISSQELVRAVQGYECEPWEARETLRYHVHRVRRKIRQVTGRTDVIRTVRGVGYGLSEAALSS